MIDIIGWIEGWHLERILQRAHDDSEKIWSKMHPTVQEILKDSSAVVELLRQGVNLTPDFLVDKIQEKLPFFNKEKLTATLQTVGLYLRIGTDVEDQDLNIMLPKINAHIQSLGDKFEPFTETLAAWIADHNTPKENTFGVIAGIIKYVFTTFVKGKYSI